jgi:DNA-binding transcriptional regulator YdaS (Cro superfamily)
MTPIEKIKIEFGTLRNLSKELGISPNAIAIWGRNNKVPFKYIRKIEQLSEGRLTTEDLRPDLFKN